MHTHSRRKQKGQTLFEFALTLPILLLLTFGIIEFGRVFQAWVTLNNAARTAARYASTGQYNETKYVINDDKPEDPGSIVDCVLNQDLRGTLTNRSVNPGETVQVYDGREGLFATWYDGENCEPNRVDHQDMRKDIARILSITDEARRGAAGLALGPDPLEGVTTEAQVRNFLYSFWERPLPGGGQYIDQAGADQPSFFEVVICSSRGPRNAKGSTEYSTDFGTRFITVLDGNEITTDDPRNADARAPECILNEQPENVGGATQNAGTPWLDAGGPGDTVSIVINFNHPLVTPLGLAPYIPLQARRAAVNETFRAAEATGALRGGGAITADINISPVAVAKVQNGTLGGDGYTITVGVGDTTGPVFLDGTGSSDPDGDPSSPDYLHYQWHRNLLDGTVEVFKDPGTGLPYDSPTPPSWVLPLGRHEIILTVTDAEGATDTDTVVVTITGPSPTETLTDTPEPVATSTEIQPFSCDRLHASDVEFFNNRVWIQFTNDNFQETVMTRAQFYWKTLPLYPNMYVSGMSLDGILHWRGQDFSPPTDTNADPTNPSNLFVDADRRVSGNSTSTWEAVFANGPSPIQDPASGTYYMTQNDLSGTTFTFENPDGGFCVIPLTLPTPTPVPNGKATNTPVPVCISGDIQIRFVKFSTFGVVQMTITNLRNFPAELTDFSINWKGVNNPRLEWVAVGGSTATDRVNGVLIWQGQDTNPPTVGGSTAASANAVNNYSTGATGREGTWLTNYTLPANSTTNVWIKFGVTNSPPDTAFNMFASDLTDRTWFQIGCAGGGAGAVNPQQEPSPFPSDTPGPTNTPRPTFTPSKTPTKGPTKPPPPPATITNTPRPSNTPPPSATPSRVPPGGGGGSGCPDGSC